MTILSEHSVSMSETDSMSTETADSKTSSLVLDVGMMKFLCFVPETSIASTVDGMFKWLFAANQKLGCIGNIEGGDSSFRHEAQNEKASLFSESESISIIQQRNCFETTVGKAVKYGSRNTLLSLVESVWSSFDASTSDYGNMVEKPTWSSVAGKSSQMPESRRNTNTIVVRVSRRDFCECHHRQGKESVEEDDSSPQTYRKQSRGSQSSSNSGLCQLMIDPKTEACIFDDPSIMPLLTFGYDSEDDLPKWFGSEEFDIIAHDEPTMATTASSEASLDSMMTHQRHVKGLQESLSSVESQFAISETIFGKIMTTKE